MAGSSYFVQVSGAADAATFLATDFMDNGGKCSPSIYRDSDQLNFNSQSFGGTASPTSTGTVLVCSSPANLRWSFLGQNFLTGEGFGNVASDWEWIRKSMLARDNGNLGVNANYYSFITNTSLINQTISVNPYSPGTKGTVIAPGGLPQNTGNDDIVAP